MRRLLIAGVALGLTGCASNVPDVTVAYVSLVDYDSYTCAQLSREAERAYAHGGSLTQVGIKDAIVIPWPAASLGKGPGEYTSQLGTIKSIERASAIKKCALSSPYKSRGL